VPWQSQPLYGQSVIAQALAYLARSPAAQAAAAMH